MHVRLAKKRNAKKYFMNTFNCKVVGAKDLTAGEWNGSYITCRKSGITLFYCKKKLHPKHIVHIFYCITIANRRYFQHQ